MPPLHWPADSDWTPVLQPVFETAQFQSLQNFVADERLSHAVYPSAPEVFNAFRRTPLSQVKVVILGQDPYHGPGQAHGLSFSAAGDCQHPPSLKNIFKELADDLQQPMRENGDLTDWASQGVLLLNTVLTVRAGEAHSHAKQGWEKFTDEVIRQVGRCDRKIVFLLWGKPAQKKSMLLASGHEILSAPHPSPLSAYRGFFGSRPFSQSNRILVESGQSPVKWNF